MLLKRRVSFTSASGAPRRVRHENTTNSVFSMAVHRSQSDLSFSGSVRTVPAAMQGSPPPPNHALSPTPECRWKRGRPVASPIRTGGLRHSTSRLWAQDLPIRFAQNNPVMLAARQENDQQSSTTCRATFAPGADANVSKSTLEHRNQPGSSRFLRFAPTTDKRGLHTTSTTSRPEMTHQLHVGSENTSNGSSSDVRAACDDSEGGIGTKQQNIESNTFPISKGESRTNNTMKRSNGSGYVTSQDHKIESDQSGDTGYEEEDDAEQHVPLAYQIPDDMLRAAMMAPPNTRASYWSQKLYRGPQNKQISTHYCRSLEVAERVAQYFLNKKVLGFDIEWKPRANPASIKMNVSLIQLACEDRIALFHISLFPGTRAQQLMPPTLKTILESPDIYKVGVAVKGDFSRLNKYLDIQAQGVFELSRLHNDVELYATEPGKASNKLVGLATQVLQHLQLPLYKGGPLDDNSLGSTNVRESDWSQPLDLQQIHYAAADAYAGFRLYHVLDWKRKQLKPVPPRRGLCDYDSKPAPRTKDVQKKPRAARKPKDEKAAVPGQTALATEQEKEPADEVEEEYSMLEELTDSHQLEDSNPASESESSEAMDNVEMLDVPRMTRLEDNKPQIYERIDRVNPSCLKDSDPGYLILTKTHEDGNVESSQDLLFDGHSKGSLTDRDEHDQSHGDLFKEGLDEEEDEFADPELEHALLTMYTDHNGDLMSDPRADNFPSRPGFEQHLERNVHILNVMLKENQIPGSVHVEEYRSAEHQDENNAIDLSEENSANDNFQTIETETASTCTFKPLADQPEDTSRTYEYNLATQWAQNYLYSTVPPLESKTSSRIRATVPHLRTYHMWHHQKLALDDIAKQLRDPPFSQSTVSSYLLQAITLEDLEYDKAAVRDVLMAMPEGLRKGRWKWLALKVGALS